MKKILQDYTKEELAEMIKPSFRAKQIYDWTYHKYASTFEEMKNLPKDMREKLNEEYIAIISYSDEQDYMPQKLWQPGTPALWFLKSDGEPLFQPLMGALPAKGLLQALGIAKDEFDKLQKKKK